MFGLPQAYAEASLGAAITAPSASSKSVAALAGFDLTPRCYIACCTTCTAMPNVASAPIANESVRKGWRPHR